jgi:hypothetical protein
MVAEFFDKDICVSVTIVFTDSGMLSVSCLIPAQIWPLITQVRWLRLFNPGFLMRVSACYEVGRILRLKV